MNKTLRVLIDGAEIGTMVQNILGKFEFSYDDAWRVSPTATPLSMSMPLAERHHAHEAVAPFLWGLLPDNELTLIQLGRRYGVSPGNPFALLGARGEDLQGAVQMVPADRIGTLEKRKGVTWLTADALAERFKALTRDPSATDFTQDGGKFSLAGAQRKLTLTLVNGRWGEPRGRTPSTHILKPNIEGLPGQVYNEMFCLRLAPLLGLPAPPTWVEQFGAAEVIVVQRFDRMRLNGDKRLPLTSSGGDVHRVHQEDMCQALKVLPANKYQRDGGPGMQQIMQLLSSSAEPSTDRDRFMRACVFNYVIGASDAHAKNYSILLTSGGLFRLAPLYDIASWLPYAQRRRDSKLAMSVGGHYEYDALLPRHWEVSARKCSYDPHRMLGHVRDLIGRLPDVCDELLGVCRQEGLPDGELTPLVTLLKDRVAQLRRTYGAEAAA
jgi:serine/threonine-protein kinase HipA